MAFNLRRLRAGELLTAAAVVALLVALFGLRWSGTRDGWQALPALRWLLLVALALGAALVIAQAARRAPAIPACLDTVSTVVAFVALVWLVVAVASGSALHAGAWLGLAAGVALEAGSFLALRQEGTLEADGPAHIPVVALPAPGKS